MDAALLATWLVCTKPWVQSPIWEMAQTCNPSTREVDLGKSRTQDQPWVSGEQKEREGERGRKEKRRKGKKEMKEREKMDSSPFFRIKFLSVSSDLFLSS